MSGAWTIAGFGFFAGFVFNEVMWRIANALRGNLVDVQRQLIDEQNKVIDLLRGDQ